MSTLDSFRAHQIGDLPFVAYVPEFITQAEESRVLSEVYSSKAKWTQLSGRRLQNHGGVVHPKGLIYTPVAVWLHPLMDRCHQATGIYGSQAPNHVLINAYQPGEGILPHEDGAAYHPGVCIVSLSAPAVLRFRRKQCEGVIKPDADLSVLLMPRSLVAFAEEAYTSCLHSIDAVEEELLDSSVANLHMYNLQPGDKISRGGQRTSLTIRRVDKVFKNILGLR